MKVFGVGLPRTGTSSLCAALNMLGIRATQFPKELHEDIDHKIIRQFDGFTDVPIPLIYQELDQLHPGSKFIHTIRDEDSWLKSIEWLLTTGKVKYRGAFENWGNEFNAQLFGTTKYEEDRLLRKFRTYNEQVREYFAARPGDYLVIDLTRGEGFEKLCPFLDLPVPATAFPNVNKKEHIWKVFARKAYRAIRRKIPFKSGPGRE